MTEWGNQMAKGILVTLTEQELLTLRTRCVADLVAGSTVTSWSDSGTSVGKQVSMNTENLLDEVTYALQKRWPAKYGSKNRHLSSDLSGLDFN